MNVTLLTLVAYGAALVGIGLWAARRSAATADYLLGGRRLGPVVAALSASASSSSAWTLLGVSGAAYVWGLSALWLLPATLGGFVLNWYVVAPRLQRLSHASGALTLTEVLVPPELGDARPRVLRLAAMLVLIAFLFYIASQFEGAAKAFASALGYSRESGIIIGAGIVMFYTLLGGFWAASVSDALQGLTMVAAAIVLPLAGLVAVGGPVALWQALPAAWSASEASLVRGLPALAGLFFVLGTLGIGLGYPGQPHVVNRFMALRDAAALRQGRRVAIGWAVVIYTGMLLVGFSARVLFPDIGDSEQALFQLADRLLPAVVAAVLVAAVLSAIMSTADSQL
ncbi:MAG: sodium/proline symporter, partial [Pseudomonadota bacterium]